MKRNNRNKRKTNETKENRTNKKQNKTDKPKHRITRAQIKQNKHIANRQTTKQIKRATETTLNANR